METRPSRVFGPVPSRRLGLSLGIDILPFKTCTYDCVYCQLGRTTDKTTARTRAIPIEGILQEVSDRLAQGPKPDYLTLSGSGEPTLHLGLAELIRALKSSWSIPVALLTNGSLLHLDDVRRAVLGVDLLVPTLVTGDEETFQRIHRPAPGLTLSQTLQGIMETRRLLRGCLWLEVFLVKGVNDSLESLDAMRRIVDRIDPHLVHVNTAVRPPADSDVKPLTAEAILRACSLLGPKAIPASDAKSSETTSSNDPAFVSEREVLSLIQRHPCTTEDVAAGLGCPSCLAIPILEALLRERRIEAFQRGGKVYYAERH